MNPAKPAPAQVVGNQPTGPGGPAAGQPGQPQAGQSGMPPATNLVNVPVGGGPTPGQPGQPGATPTEATYANIPEKVVHDTNHPKPAGASGGGGSLLSKLKPHKSQDKINTVSSDPSGPPIVRPTTPVTGPGGKQTRFSDTAHAAEPVDGVTNLSNVPQVDGESPHKVPIQHAPGASPGVAVVDGKNKLHKGKPAIHQDGQPGAPGMGHGTVVATPGGGPSGTPAVISSTPAPAGSPAITKITPPPAGLQPKPAADTVVPEILETITLPDGTTAYVRPAPAAAAGGKKGKTIDETTNKTKVTGHPGGGAESQQGHCSVCCPSAARTQQGVPVQPCAHQDGPLGNAVPGSATNKTNNKTKPMPPAAPLNLPGETAVTVEEDRMVAPDGSGKLKKKVTAGPGGAAGPSMSPEERAMEDARALASELSP